MAKRALDGNKFAAQKFINTHISEEAQAAAKELGESIGGKVDLGQGTHIAQKLADSLADKNGFVAESAKKVAESFSLNSQGEFQKSLLRNIRADESGATSAILAEVANASPLARQNLGRILNQTTQNLTRQLENLGIDKNAIKTIYQDLEDTTKESYEKAINGVLGKIYDDNYKAILDPSAWVEYKAKAESKGIHIEDKFASFVEKSIYNPKGTDFETLNNAIKTINSYHKDAIDPNFRDFVRNSAERFLKDDIKKGIDNIFAQNPTAYNYARDLFDTALNDYATMKSTLKIADKLKLRDEAVSYERALENLQKYASGQGSAKEAELSTAIRNLNKLTKSIGEENRARVEVQLLNDIFQKSLYEAQELAVFDSKAFFKKIDSIGETSFLSPQAKEFIAIAKGFDSLFQNDVRLARLLAPASPDKIGSSIATTIEGAVKFQAVKMLFEQVVRLMPQIPFLRGLNEKIQGAAVRHHLRSALSKSVEVSDFKFQLRDKIARAPINTPTKDLLAQILGEVEKGEAKIAKLSTQADEQIARTIQAEETWIREFGLSDINQSKKVEIHPLIREALGKDLEITPRDFEKIMELGRDKYIQDIMPTLKNPDYAFIDSIGELIIARSIDDRLFFVSVSKDYGEAFRNLTLSPKKDTNILKKLNEAKEVIISPQTSSPSAHKAFTGFLSSTNRANDDIITQTKPTTQDSLFTRALQEKQAQIKEAEERLAKEQELAESKAKELAQLRADIISQKQAIAGLAANERVLNIGESIPMQKVENLPSTSIAINENEIYPLDFVIVKKQDLKPNFNASELQGRTEANTHTIQDIANNFNPQKILGRGGFQDLPIIRKDGAIISGNHRTQGMLEFSQESRAAYEKAIKEQYGITLKDDELLMRTPKNLSAQDELNLAFLSNKDNLDNLGDKALASLGKYDKAIKDIPNQIQSESVDELSAKVAKLLEKDNAYPDIESTNLALLSHLAKNSNGRNIAEVLNSLSRLEPTDRVKIKDMFVKNAGELHNLCNQAASHSMQSLELRPYLLDSISATANALTHTRAENFERLAKDIKALLDTTDKNGANAMLETMPSVYKDTLGELLGASLARFVRLENPAGSLYEVLKDAPVEIAHMIEPALFNQGGKALKDADIYDFIEYLIRTGERSEATSGVIEMLPKLREKQLAFDTRAREIKASKGADADAGTKTSSGSDIIADFGTNYAEFYHKPIEAFKKLQAE